MRFYDIRLELARDREDPEGNPGRGYRFVAPLTEDGHLDAAALAERPEAATAERFWDGEITRLGQLRHRQGRWAFDYDPEDEDDDEVGFRFAQHVFRVGEYVSIDEPDHGMRTFRIVSVTPAGVS